MAVFNRVYCPNCKKNHNIYEDNIREIACNRCGRLIAIKASESNYFMEYYADGKRKRKKVSSSRKLAELALQKRKVEIAEGRFLDIKKEIKIRFEDFSDEYLELHSKINNKSWKKSDATNIKTLKKHFTGKYLFEITSKMIEEFKSKRLAEEVAPATVNRNLICLKSIFNKAILWQKAEANPVKGVKMLKEDNKRLRYLEKEEIVKLLTNCRQHLKPIVIIALNTGMRRGEILNLKCLNSSASLLTTKLDTIIRRRQSYVASAF